MFDFYTHLHSKTHRKTLDPYDRPWSCTGTTGTSKSLLTEEKLTKPAKGGSAALCLFMKTVSGTRLHRGLRHSDVPFFCVL
ncbi:zinc finger protein 318-like isoform X1 [Notothenia coriiceps]|uniref:Zinc finger protein 318-like isoform X1 n=1 Tax=Notothenia coriiceps TaxID=8208 RepID=A0A6I9NZ81_9TELE|nr:PREDICTED: zinc finger protein 318-like isoform X1 [Notothenia coriiceps]XP_010779702.1 PREDICTED: zinc finger protein 318-like isoform X1 [Notothenia coriiceps]